MSTWEADYYRLDRFVAEAEREDSWKSRCGLVNSSTLFPDSSLPLSTNSSRLFGLDDISSPLSNAAIAPFTIDGRLYESVDQALACLEADLAGAPRIASKIIQWPAHRIKFMNRIGENALTMSHRIQLQSMLMHEKFRVYPSLMRLLLETGGDELYALSTTDSRNGCVKKEDDSFDGLNICGRTLRVIRSRHLMHRAMLSPVELTISEPTSAAPLFTNHTLRSHHDFTNMVRARNDYEMHKSRITHITSEFMSTLVPKYEFGNYTDLASHNKCLEKHTTHLPAVVDAWKYLDGQCIYCSD